MAIRYIDNITILADVGESVTLPSKLIARQTDGSFVTVPVSWTPSTVDTSTEGEFIFEGTVSGYADKVLCSVQVGRMEDNPPSFFPDSLDQFGLPKQDIQTADIPDIDDYQYFKAKIPRTEVEEYQLKQLRELLADKIILARDINHMRNAIIAIEEYCWDLQDQIDALEKRVSELENRADSLEERVEELEEETIIDGVNLGHGERVFRRKNRSRRELEFRTLVGGEGIDIYEDGNEIVIEADGSGGSGVGCGFDVDGDSFNTCGELPSFFSSGILALTDFFNFQMVKVVGDRSPTGYWWSMLGVLGAGSSADDMRQAVRFLKADDKLLIEYRVRDDKYVGVILDNSGGDFYSESYSLIQEEIYEGYIDVYSTDVSASNYEID